MSTNRRTFALETSMNTEAVVEGLLSFAEDEWIGLWVICSDVEDELGDEDPERTLELTLVVVRELLKRGLIAGDPPVRGNAAHFNPWPLQDPQLIADFIRSEWSRRGGFPEWRDAPWFAHLRLWKPRHAGA
jgi:hypothetical protein